MSIEQPRKERDGELSTSDGQKFRFKLPPGFAPPVDVKESTRQRPRPEEPPDPRPSVFRNVPPFGGA